MRSVKFRKILSIINPQTPIGGLEISDSAARFLMIKGDNVISVSESLPPGVIEEGELKDGNRFKEILIGIHSRITPRAKKKISIILNIPDANVYTQVFNIPPLAQSNFEETVRLNLQMISPMDFTIVYADSQKIGEDNASGQMEFLGAFTQITPINELIKCLTEANFLVVAVEFNSLSLAKAVSEIGRQNLYIAKPHLLIKVGDMGLHFLIIRKNGNLYFNRFVGWQSMRGEQNNQQIPWDIFKDVLIRETHKVLNFAGSHWQEPINDFLLVADNLYSEISQVITTNFSLNQQSIVLPASFSSLSPAWLTVLGSTLRGLLPRSKDNFISLIAPGTEADYRRYQIIYFISIWRNIITASLLFMIIIFAVTQLFFNRNINALNDRLASFTRSADIDALNKLKEEAQSFNRKIRLALSAQKEKINWSVFLNQIDDLAGNNVSINRIFVQSSEAPVLVNAQAANQEEILRFKELLEKQPQFKEIDLPFNSIMPAIGGLSFTIYFKIQPQSYSK